MANGLNKILGYVYLTGLVEDIKTGIPKVLPEAFWTTKSSTVADAGRYTRYAGTRQTLRRVEYGAPSVRRNLEPIGVFDIKLAHFFEHISLKLQDYWALRSYDGYSQMNRGVDEVKRQAALFATKRDNLKVAMVHSMLAQGLIYFDVNGNLLPTSSGATLTIDYGISANNLNQLNGIITASWGTAGTDIALQITNLKARALQLTGYELKYAFYGANIPGYIARNTTAQNFLWRNPMQNQAFIDTGILPKGLFGLEWIPVNTAFFSDKDGTTQTWFGADNVTFTPEIDRSVYELMEGTYEVPTSFQPMGDLLAARNSFKEVLGDFGYAIPIGNPMTAEMHMGTTFLPIIKVPDAFFFADTVP